MIKLREVFASFFKKKFFFEKKNQKTLRSLSDSIVDDHTPDPPQSRARRHGRP